MKKHILTLALIAASTSLASVKAAVIFNFTGDFATTNWTQTIPPAGSISLAGAPTSISLTSNDGGGGPANTDFTITAPTNGTVAFSWSYSTTDQGGPTYDPFQWIVNGTPVQLTNDSGSNTQNGAESFMVSAGDIFGFRARSTDSIWGAATTIVSNFSFDDGVSVIPEPGSAVALASLISLGLLTRNRRK